MLKLYHYVHCPFCLRVRMALDYLQIPYISHIVGYDDEELPKKLTGLKMLPIVELETGEVLNESLDIIRKVDVDHKLIFDAQGEDWLKLEKQLQELSVPLFKLSMPYMIWTPEFTPRARDYFQKKKEASRGPFNQLMLNRVSLEEEMNKHLIDLESELKPFYLSSELGPFDILLASHLWSLYLVPEFQFSPKLHKYLQSVKKITNFDYHKDYWLKPLNWSEFWQSL